MRKPSKTTLRNKADRLFSEWVRGYGKCEHCSSTHELQTAHINSRKYNATRFDPLNCLCLCARCHRNFHDHPTQFVDWLKEYLGEAIYEELKLLENKTVKSTISFYQDVIKQIKNREGVYAR